MQLNSERISKLFIIKKHLYSLVTLYSWNLPFSSHSRRINCVTRKTNQFTNWRHIDTAINHRDEWDTIFRFYVLVQRLCRLTFDSGYYWEQQQQQPQQRKRQASEAMMSIKGCCCPPLFTQLGGLSKHEQRAHHQQQQQHPCNMDVTFNHPLSPLSAAPPLIYHGS